MHRIFAVAFALGIAAASAAHAQDDFSGLKLKLGSNVRVSDDGLMLEGPVTSLSADALMVADHELRPSAGLRIERDRGHTGLKGMAIGAAVGLTIGLAGSRGNGWGMIQMFPCSFLGGLIGVGMDRYVPVYDTTAVRATTSQLTVPDPLPDNTAPVFADLHAKVGDRVFVTQDGITVNGTITALSPSRLMVGSHEFGAGTSLKIEKDGDPIWDGAAIGGLVGMLIGTDREGCLHEPQWHCVAAGGLVYAGIGALIDWEHRGKTTIYDSSTQQTGHGTTVRMAPLIDAHRKGVALSLTR